MGSEIFKKNKQISPRPTLSGMLILFLLFSFTLGLGILASLKLYEFFDLQEVEIVSISPWEFLRDFLFALILIVAIFILGRRFRRERKFLLKGLFLIATGLGALVSLGVFVGDFAIGLVFILILLWLIRPTVLLQDVLVVLGIAGAGSLLGTRLASETVILLLIAFSVYDYVAVYKTKHMVKMAQEMIKEGAILGLVLPQKASGFGDSLKKVRPGGNFFVLGGGDVIFPLLLCSSLLPQGITPALVVAGFALLGLFFSFFIFARQEIRKPIPALPPIALFSIIGYLLSLLI